MNRTMRVLTDAEYNEIIDTMIKGSDFFRPNIRIALALQVESTLCLRISDVLELKMNCFEKLSDGGYKLNITEIKTGKTRCHAVSTEVVLTLKEYALNNGIKCDDKLFPVTKMAVQKHLKKVCDYLGYADVNTHSFRKYGATSVYNDTGCNIELVRRLLNHSSTAITQRYLGVADTDLNNAIVRNNKIRG